MTMRKLLGSHSKFLLICSFLFISNLFYADEFGQKVNLKERHKVWRDKSLMIRYSLYDDDSIARFTVFYDNKTICVYQALRGAGRIARNCIFHTPAKSDFTVSMQFFDDADVKGLVEFLGISLESENLEIDISWDQTKQKFKATQEKREKGGR